MTSRGFADAGVCRSVSHMSSSYPDIVSTVGGKVKAVHVKDIAPAGTCLDEDGWADPGHGVLDWSMLLPVLKEIGVTQFVAEHDKPNDVARFARRAYATVASWR